jgi:hypothetical protein
MIEEESIKNVNIISRAPMSHEMLSLRTRARLRLSMMLHSRYHDLLYKYRDLSITHNIKKLRGEGKIDQADEIEKNFHIIVEAVKFTWANPDVTGIDEFERTPYDAISIDKRVLTALECSYEDLAYQLAQVNVIGVPGYIIEPLLIHREEFIFCPPIPYDERDDNISKEE